MHHLPTPTSDHLDSPAPAGYLTSTGRNARMTVTAGCTCGWAGHPRQWGPASAADTKAELAAHCHTSGHPIVESDEYRQYGIHHRCGHRHQINDDCPVPHTSPAGLLVRVCQSTLGKPDAAEDALSAAQALAEWADSQLFDTVIGARMNGLDRHQIDAATSRSGSHSRARWNLLIDRLEAAGLLPVSRPLT